MPMHWIEKKHGKLLAGKVICELCARQIDVYISVIIVVLFQINNQTHGLRFMRHCVL